MAGAAMANAEAPGRGFEPSEGGEHLRERPARRSGTLTINALRLGLLALFLVAWEVIPRLTDSQFWVSTPSEVWEQIVEWTTSGFLMDNLLITLQEMALGLVIGSAIGIGFGFVLGVSPRLSKVLEPFIIAIYSLPRVALAPLFVLWFGLGLTMKVVLISLIVFFLVFWNTHAGVRNTDHELIDVARLMGAKRRQILAKVVLPSSLDYIYLGLKLAVPYALIGAIVGEMVASNRGMGYVLMSAAGNFNTAGMMAALVVLIVVSWTLNGALERSQRYVLGWKRAGRSDEP